MTILAVRPGRAEPSDSATSANSLPADGSSSAIITAYITDSAGNPVRHYTEVTFTTNLGHFRNGGTSYTMSTQPPLGPDGFPNPDAAPTGIAEVQLIAGKTPGTDKITVSSNGVTNSVYITFERTTDITLTVSPQEIPADGTSWATVSATMKDVTGSFVPVGTSVEFTTTLGTFENGLQNYTVKTIDDTGVVQAGLRASITPGTALITATVNGTVAYASLGIGLTPEKPLFITLAATPSSLPANGVSSSQITVTITDSSGAPARAGTIIRFKTGLGFFQNGQKNYWVYTPDDTGIVKLSFIAGVVPGTTYVIASTNGVSQALSFFLTNANASKLSLSANPRYIEADGKSTSLVTATVATLSGKPIKNIPVTFYLTGQSSSPLPPNNTYTGNRPMFTTPFYSNGGNTLFIMNFNGTGNFAVWLWDFDTNTRVTLLENEIGAVSNDYIYEVLNAGNYFLEIDFITDPGDWSIQVSGDITSARLEKEEIVLGIENTNENGNAEYTYTSTNTPQTVSIRAETGEVSKSKEALSKVIDIFQTGGPPPLITLTAQDTSIYANGESSTTIDASVLDASGNPAPDGTIVTFSATAGTLGDASATASAMNTITAGTSNGVASVKLTSVASATTVQSTVTGTVGSDSDSITVTFSGVSLSNMQATPSAIFANGTDTSSITVRLQDAERRGDSE